MATRKFDVDDVMERLKEAVEGFKLEHNYRTGRMVVKLRRLLRLKRHKNIVRRLKMTPEEIAVNLVIDSNFYRRFFYNIGYQARMLDQAMGRWTPSEFKRVLDNRLSRVNELMDLCKATGMDGIIILNESENHFIQSGSLLLKRLGL